VLTRIGISAILCITCAGVSAQGKWHNLISYLEEREMSLSVGVLMGVSYFDYDTKEIEKHFPTGEVTLDLVLSKRINDYFFIESGMRLGIKTKKAADYNYDSLEIPMKDWQYSLIDVDQALSSYNHLMFGIPLILQYQQRRLQVGIGGSYRHFSAPRSNGNPRDMFAGQHEAGVIGSVSYPIGRWRLGGEYYYGLVNVHHHGSYVSVGGPNKIAYKTFSRVAQLAISYNFGIRRH
jgi:hypothetical protein